MARSRAQAQNLYPWRFTDVFLPDLARGTHQQDGQHMETWIRSDLEGLFRRFRSTELSGGRYVTLGRILTNNETQWLKHFKFLEDRAMNLPDDLSSLLTDENTRRALEISLVDFMRQMCNSNGMPIEVSTGNKHSKRKDPERMRLRYRVAYGLLLTVISDLQNESTYFLRQGLPADILAPWADDSDADDDSDQDESESESDQPRTSASTRKRNAGKDSSQNGKACKKPRRERSQRASDNNDEGPPAKENREQGAGEGPGDAPNLTQQPDNIIPNNGAGTAEDPAQRLHDEPPDNELANAQRRVVQLEAALKKAQETLKEVIEVLKEATNPEE